MWRAAAVYPPDRSLMQRRGAAPEIDQKTGIRDGIPRDTECSRRPKITDYGNLRPRDDKAIRVKRHGE